MGRPFLVLGVLDEMVGFIDWGKVLKTAGVSVMPVTESRFFGASEGHWTELHRVRTGRREKPLTNDRIGSIFSAVTLANADLILH